MSLRQIAAQRPAAASKAIVTQPASNIGESVACIPNRFRYSPLEAGCDIRTVQELLGHADVRATMIYTHVLGRGAMGVKSPLDR